MNRIIFALLTAAALVLTACGGSDSTASAPAASVAALTVSSDPSGQLKYVETTLTAPANTAFEVSFSNPSPLQHNWVLVQPGQEQAVAAAADPATGAVPAGTAGVIVAGKTLNQSQTETIAVPATAAGSYSYICTLAGHYAAGMKGTLTIQ